MSNGTNEEVSKTEKKMVIGFRPKPWLSDKIQKYMNVHQVNQSDALHGIIEELQLKAGNSLEVEKLEKDKKALLALIDDLEKKLKIKPEAAASAPIEGGAKPVPIYDGNFIECQYQGLNAKEIKKIPKRWCDICTTYPQTDLIPCEKRKPTGSPKPQ